MTLAELLQKINTTPDAVQFDEVIDVIDRFYRFTATGFTNGNLYNELGKNVGSCKILAFAQLHKLGKSESLNLFGEYYRTEVLEAPNGANHGNIRALMTSGLESVKFEVFPLEQK